MPFNATVCDIREASRVNGKSLWHIQIDDGRLEPRDAGAGTLTAQSTSGTRLVAEILAVVRDAAGETWLVTEKPLPIGTQVTVTIAEQKFGSGGMR